MACAGRLLSGPSLAAFIPVNAVVGLHPDRDSLWAKANSR